MENNYSISDERPNMKGTRPFCGVDFDLLSEKDLVRYVIRESKVGNGGRVVTPNVDILRQVRKNPEALLLVRHATLTVPDGMPLIWAGKLSGKPFVERVTGSSLIFTLTAAAAEAGLSVYLLGGKPGVAEAAGENLANRYPGLKVVGADGPPLGFNFSPKDMATVSQSVMDATPNIVYVGLGFPKQEWVICELAPLLPSTWFIGCGAAIPFAAGSARRAPEWMQRYGLEWAHRLASEPRRLFRRYIFQGLPYAAELLARAVISRAVTAWRG
jgi:N-acetylglucosaminyldiphosphoundecaprenol N-acetyl-beta-D-mannosaminyltransferase